jgi:serine/threonine protein phosphatase 1
MSARTIAIGDIHGCALALDALLAAIAPTPEDTIITLGDYVNRGPDSRRVVDRLIALRRECQLVSILGNHDQLFLECLTGHGRMKSVWLRMGGEATLGSYGTKRDMGAVPRSHVAFFEGCRRYHETQSHIFAHANYDHRLPMDRQRNELLRWESLRDTIPRPHFSGKTVIVGHSSQKNGEVLDLGYLKCIDTYCHGGGWLTGLDVDSGKLWQFSKHGKPRVAKVPG